MQVFIFGAARSAVIISNSEQQLVLEKLLKGQRVLDWTLHGLRKAGIKDAQISFIGGYKVEQIISLYPELHYVINPKWEDTHVLGSLKYAMESWKGGDVLLMYADTIFRPPVIANIIQSNSLVTIGTDSEWMERVSNPLKRHRAEKIIIKDEIVKSIGRETLMPDNADAQFSGLTLIKKEVAQKIFDGLHAEDDNEQFFGDNDSLTDLICLFIDHWNIPVTVYDHSGLWAELDSESDLAQFVFGTKAETLERIQPFVKESVITDQIHFTLHRWELNSDSIIQQVQKKFKGKKLIVRSSSLEEDSWESSQAGAFLSVADVDADDYYQVQKAIADVIEGFRNKGSGEYNSQNQVLVQPFIGNVEMSGVAFTRNLEHGTPYYLINYDDQSKRTDTVTSGSSNDSKSITIYKNSKQRIKDARIQKVVRVLQEIETITGYSSLDIEFVLTQEGDLFVVQVRPITTHTGLGDIGDFHKRMEEAKEMIRLRMKPFHNIYGQTTVLADMPDWNPAEMIGVRPNPLALSLYKYLITDSAWRIARGKMGYHNPVPERLLFAIGGHPYIDVRNSFNNLLPSGISDDLAEKLINHYVERLKENPHLHDKVEFDIVVTCYTPDIEEQCERLRAAGITDAEIGELKKALRTLTENAISGKNLSASYLVAQTEKLNPRRAALLHAEIKPSQIPSLIQTLLDDCIEFGTIPFSILARYGFIAASMLRGLVAKNIISNEEKNLFLNTIETVAGNLTKSMNSVINGTLDRDEFLKEYGHLRPGSYDINSYSYKERPEHYLPEHDPVSSNTNSEGLSEHHIPEFNFSEQTKASIENKIQEMGMSFSVETLLSFIKEATAAREYAKFQFTKNLDAILSLIAVWGEHLNFQRMDLANVFIEDILKVSGISMDKDIKLYLKQKIQEGKNWHESVNKIETPQIITHPDDLDIIEHNKAEPNYVTSKSVTATICHLSNILDKKDLEGKIVLTEGADPGYDWIFLHPIKGLITKYGGAASHMTIRSAEFGLPAAIGCGEEWFDRLKKAKNIELNCMNKQIRILG